MVNIPMPAAAVGGHAAIMGGLLHLLDSSRARPHVAAAALHIVQAMAVGLLSAEEAANGEAGMSLAAWAILPLRHCAAMLCDASLQHAALPAALALVPLIGPPVDAPPGTCTTGARPALIPLLAALTEALRLSLVSSMPAPTCRRCTRQRSPWLAWRHPAVQVAECTSAGVAPPDHWDVGFHALTLGPGTRGILHLLVGLLERWTELVTAQV